MLEESTKSELLQLARETITLGTEAKKNNIDLANYSPVLQEHGASFVTLKIQNRLKGCIGSLQASRPLVLDVSENAHAAAFQDTRFTPVTHSDLELLRISVSILSKPEKMNFKSEQDLIGQLRPHEDGLILQDNHHRGTFLPSVWESLGDPKEFLAQLKIKAGLEKNYWSDDLQIQRYTTESFSEN
ncbi:MAG: AmmeMemoRadiSam system protein A [Acidiferrobacterales bacterium]